PAGIDHVEQYAVPLDLAKQAVARRAGNLGYDGLALADQTVKERRFAHVGPPYQGDKRFSHRFVTFAEGSTGLILTDWPGGWKAWLRRSAKKWKSAQAPFRFLGIATVYQVGVGSIRVCDTRSHRYGLNRID